MRPLLLILFFLSMSMPVHADDKLPALDDIPGILSTTDKIGFAGEQKKLKKELRDFQDTGDAFNLKSAEEQTDEEFAVLEKQQAHYVTAAVDFNKRLSEAKAARIRGAMKGVALKNRRAREPLGASFELASIQSTGEFYIVTGDGALFLNDDASGVPVDDKTTAITGPGGHAVLLLPDGTTFTIGQNCEVVLDDFVYDPKTGVKKMSVKLLKGGFRWVTGKTRTIKPMFDLVSTVGGIRGTDFECAVAPDGTGFVKLHSGEFELTDKMTGAVVILTSGQMVSFTDSSLGAPTRFQADV